MTGNLSDDSASSPKDGSSLVKWWKRFNSKKAAPLVSNVQPVASTSQLPVFGVSLQESLPYASIAISQVGPDKRAAIYGHIPVVVAKTGLYLKENGTTTQGVFRVSGSNKRIKELELIFDSGPSYGKDLTWDSFSVHDAASVFKRYINLLPEPIIPFAMYHTFQDALPRPKPPQQLTASEHNKAIATYKSLINSLPPAHQHIFFYVLDLLGVFARKSDQNLMPASNLATIFQPGLIRHEPSSGPSHDEDKDGVKAHIEADAAEHKRSQEVLEFLIKNQSSFELELPPQVIANRKAKRKSTTPTVGSFKNPFATNSSSAPTASGSLGTKSTSSASKPLPLSPPLSPKMGRPSSPVVKSDEENDWAAARREVAALSRKGSDKSEHRRRRQQRKLLEQGPDPVVGVKRSRTLPSGKEGRLGRKSTVIESKEPLQLKPDSPRLIQSPSSAPSRPNTASSVTRSPITQAPLSPKQAVLSTSPKQVQNASPSLSVSTSALPRKSIDRSRSPGIESAASDMSTSPLSASSEKKSWWKPGGKRASIDARNLKPTISRPEQPQVILDNLI